MHHSGVVGNNGACLPDQVGRSVEGVAPAGVGNVGQARRDAVTENPYGDGNAASKIVDWMLEVSGE